MKLFLDTCTLLWLMDAPEWLSPAATAALNDSTAVLYASESSLLEIVLKHRVGKLKLSRPPAAYWARLVNSWSLKELPISAEMILRLGNIPLHHKDPFDHMLIAQAQVHGLQIVSSDSKFSQYGVPVIW